MWHPYRGKVPIQYIQVPMQDDNQHVYNKWLALIFMQSFVFVTSTNWASISLSTLAQSWKSRTWSGCYGNPFGLFNPPIISNTRTLPIVLPHELFGWLDRQQLIPKDAVDPKHVAAYWNHLQATDSPLKNMSPGHHVPLWIWGDGATWRMFDNDCVRSGAAWWPGEQEQYWSVLATMHSTRRHFAWFGGWESATCCYNSSNNTIATPTLNNNDNSNINNTDNNSVNNYKKQSQ